MNKGGVAKQDWGMFGEDERHGMFLQVLWRDSLPRTASNKVMRRLLRDELRSQSRL